MTSALVQDLKVGDVIRIPASPPPIGSEGRAWLGDSSIWYRILKIPFRGVWHQLEVQACDARERSTTSVNLYRVAQIEVKPS